MRIVIQRVSEANVVIHHTSVASIQKGFLLLVGIEENDSHEDAKWLSEKIIKMRLFPDESGVMNIDINEAKGDIIVVSQFTLHAQTKKGNRPSYIKAARPERAIPIYEYFVTCLQKELRGNVATGKFGADMKVHLVNDGPVTILMDSKQRE